MRKEIIFWTAAMLLGILAIGVSLHAQTVSPVISEYGKKASGEFTVTNNALVPEAVAVEAMSFSVGTDGKSIFRPLDPGVDVQLSTQSARLGPRQSYVVNYEVHCAVLPCAVTIFSTLTGLHTTEGIAMAIHLPHVIYVCNKPKACRQSMRRAWGVGD
jgi:hypothetical protein